MHQPDVPRPLSPPPPQDDLTALRTSLASKIAYIEADLTAYALPERSARHAPFRVAARSLRGFDEGAADAPGFHPAPVMVDGDTTAADPQVQRPALREQATRMRPLERAWRAPPVTSNPPCNTSQPAATSTPRPRSPQEGIATTSEAVDEAAAANATEAVSAAGCDVYSQEYPDSSDEGVATVMPVEEQLATASADGVAYAQVGSGVEGGMEWAASRMRFGANLPHVRL
jgi:hypothetical protein